MKTVIESEKRGENKPNMFVSALAISAVLLVGCFVVSAQIEANNTWITDCNEKYGEDNWEIRDATPEERIGASHIFFSVLCPFPI